MRGDGVVDISWPQHDANVPINLSVEPKMFVKAFDIFDCLDRLGIVVAHRGLNRSNCRAGVIFKRIAIGSRYEKCPYAT